MRIYIIAITVVIACLGCAIAAVPDIERPSPSLPEVTVLVDGAEIGLPTSAATVGQLLDSLGVTLSSLDRTFPAPNQPVADGLEVRVTRVSSRKLVEEEVLRPETIVLSEPELPAGYTKILAHGSDGFVRRVWRVWAKDGEETSRGLVNEIVLKPVSDTVVLRGTYGAPTRGGNWRRPMTMTATAYDPGPRSCGKYADGYTATGAKAEKGVVAVDDRVIPMGTRMYIPGYGFAIAADRGSAIKGNRIDLCYPTYRQAIQFGRKKVKVYLLD